MPSPAGAPSVFADYRLDDLATLRTVDMIAIPIARLISAVATFTSILAPVTKGATAAAIVARPAIQPKKVLGLGANSSSTCISPVATIAAAAARSAYRQVFEFTSAPFDCGTNTWV